MEKTRLIIPFWGEEYLGKVLDITLPALLASGNLPTFAKSFDLEVRLITESRFSRAIWSAPTVLQLAKIADVQTVAIDDLLTNAAGHYGVTLTYAYWLGFRDLGPQMIDRSLLFLNADFVVADGSYSRLANRLKNGERVILSPSFRVCSEDIIPIFREKFDRENKVIAVTPRSMVSLAFRFKHPTVVARTINQEAFHLECMDQYYWYVDASTMIGYQHPVALVAARPQQELIEPTLMWDFSFVPDLCPNAPMSFLDDSDDFFMVELQERQTGSDLVHPGWLSRDDMVKLLGGWSSEWQRACGQHMLTFHARELPPDFERVSGESKEFMADIARRLARFSPKSHLDHPFSSWFKSVAQQFSWDLHAPPPSILGYEKTCGVKGIGLLDWPATPQPDDTHRPQRRDVGIKTILRKVATMVYDKVIGRIPNLHRTHPLWHEMQHVMSCLPRLTKSDQGEILFVVVGRSELSRYYRIAGIQPKIFSPNSKGYRSPTREFPQPVIRFCFIEADSRCISELRRLCERLRPYLDPNGELLIYIHNHDGQGIVEHDIWFLHNSFPDFGASKVRWFGNVEHAQMLQRFKMPVKTGLAPLVWHALKALVSAIKVAYINSKLASGGSEMFNPNFTAILVETKPYHSSDKPY